MKKVAIFEAKTRLSELVEEVERGEQITITRRGEPVARLVAAAPVRREASQRQRISAVLARMKRRREGITLDADIHAVIAEGRE